MRIIKFRGKRVDNGEWVYGSYLHWQGLNKGMYVEHQIMTSIRTPFNPYGYFEVIPETVGQYNGVTDIDGKEIYAGDIAKAANDDISVIKFGDWQYTFGCGDSDEIMAGIGFHWSEGEPFSKAWEDGNYLVLGNIYDNPEPINHAKD